MIQVLVLPIHKPWHNLVMAALERNPRYQVVGVADDRTGAIEAVSSLKGEAQLNR